MILAEVRKKLMLLNVGDEFIYRRHNGTDSKYIVTEIGEASCSFAGHYGRYLMASGHWLIRIECDCDWCLDKAQEYWPKITFLKELRWKKSR